MNDKIYQLIIKILDSDLLRDTKDEVVRFYTLPRNTPVKPMIEMAEKDIELGVIERPSSHDIQRKNNPKMAESEDAIKETLKDRINNN